METVKTQKNGQHFFTNKHVGPRKNFIWIEDDQVVKTEHNPGVRELVVLSIYGLPLKDLEFKYIVAYRDGGSLVRLQNGYDKREDAEIAAFAVASIYEEVHVLQTNHKIPLPSPIDEEYDSEARDRDQYESYSRVKDRVEEGPEPISRFMWHAKEN